MKKIVKKVLSIVFAVTVSCGLPLFAEYNAFGIPDSSELRRALSKEWFEGPLDLIRLKNSEIRTNSAGVRYQVRLEEQEDTFMVITAPEAVARVDVYDSTGVHTVEEKTFSADAPGAWSIIRRKTDGAVLSIRYYFAKDNGIWFQIRPYGKTTHADLLIFGSYAARSVPLGLPIESFYAKSFNDVYELTKRTVPWNYVSVEDGSASGGLYNDSLVMIQTIRQQLTNIASVEDGIYDENGNPVNLITGQKRIIAPELKGKISVSSAGFVKWIVDGLVEPVAGSYLKRDPLIQRTVKYSDTSYNGILSNTKFDLSFALDWTRNLAAAALSVRSHRTYLYKDSGVDVKIEPFAAEMTANGIESVMGYVKDSGYRLQYLKPLLYVLAVSEPNYCYLVAIRQSAGTTPDVLAFNESAVIFPYFDSTGAFRVVVFYDGAEYKFTDFIHMISGRDTFVHLTRVRTSSKYYPQEP